MVKDLKIFWRGFHMKTISRTNDLAYKKAFSTDGNTAPLIGLANDILDITIVKLNFKQPYSISDFAQAINRDGLIGLTETIKDISASIVTEKDANLVNELQVRKTSDFASRSLYYPTVTFAENYNKDGNKYGDLKPMYGINILGFKMFKKDKFGKTDRDGIRQFEFWDRRHETGFPLEFIIAYYEYTKSKFLTQNQLYWRDYFMDRPIPPEAPGYIKDAARVVEFSNLEKEEREMLSYLERAEADLLAREDYVRKVAARKVEKEITRKAEKALREERLITFQLLVSLGMTHEQIAAKYYISADEVMKILNNVYDDDIDDVNKIDDNDEIDDDDEDDDGI